MRLSCLLAFAISTKKEICDKIKSKEEGKVELSDDLENKLKYLERKNLYNSIVLIHNHPNGTPLSRNDISVFFKYKSVKYTIAVGSNGIVYIVEKLPYRNLDIESFEKFKKDYDINFESKKKRLILEGKKENREFSYKDAINLKDAVLKENSKGYFKYYSGGL